eukprot:TRINITY_DN10621_c0_g3_i3.p1 TRINITY_DN10621_c0_g3~~TRINITY_DN10621_c0_g3_i3.p1  ORF type:complete len:502 (+),score=160.20 TRINITY_DN10621_c0_g3_i3:68-1507(+)
MVSAVAGLLLASTVSDVPADLVDQVPGFNKTSFKVYSGYLTVKGPFALTDYDELRIHYQLDQSQRSASSDPIVTWHQGGPGGSSMYGLYAEMGYFQTSDRGEWVNENSWNKVANMLYLESPAGSGEQDGFSVCLKGGEVQKDCSWDDRSQAEAYAHTLMAFFDAFPEFKSNDLFLTGESYAGQYVPNIANYILTNASSKLPNFKGIAIGNACWGGDAHTVQCNGPNEDKMDVDLFYGKGLVAKKLRDATYAACGWSNATAAAADCNSMLDAVDTAVGPHNVYNIYDNCPGAAAWSQASGKSTGWLRRFLRSNMHRPAGAAAEAKALGGGYDWACGGMNDYAKFFERADVQKALHLNKPGQSGFRYRSSGPASVTLYPSLVEKIRVLVYNGDADSCVPYIGNEEWTTGLAAKGVVTETKGWHPWYATESVPAGYATTYKVTKTGTDFTFITIRLAGHMVPTFRPKASLEFFTRFLEGKAF